MLDAEFIQNMPPPPDVGDERYPGVQTRFYVMAEGVPEDAMDTDTGWLAQFYLTPNVYFWPAPTSMGMIAPLLLKLSKQRVVHGAELPTRLYPDPSGSLGMVSVYGLNRPVKKAFETAYDIAGPILDEISVKYDQPLPICHSLVVNIPSGLVTTSFPTIPEVRELETSKPVLPACPYPELRFHPL